MQRMWSHPSNRCTLRDRVVRILRWQTFCECARYLGPHLYAGDETQCNTYIRKTTQQGGATTYKSLGGAVIEKILTEDNENGADLQQYMDAHDDEIRSIISDAVKELT